MAAPEAADPPRVTQQTRTTSSTPQASTATKSLVTREFDLTLRAFFPIPPAPTKFNPIGAMKQLLLTMTKDEPSLVLRTSSNDKQIVLASATLPTGEKEFKKFFNVSTTRNDKQRQTHVCIGCYVLSDRSLGNIKFKSNDNHLLAWLKKARVFIEADSLGTDRPVTIGYFTKIEPELTHLTNFRNHLASQLMMVELDADTAVTLAPHLKTAQLDAMSNGDDFIPILPNFEVYRTRITHGREPSQVTTDVIGVKGAPKDAKLLGEFFTRLAAETCNDPRDGVYLPKGAVHLLGTSTFEQVLKENNFFLTTVATVPVNMEFAAWFALIDANDTDTEAISVYDHLLRQPWFLRLESVTRTKTIIVTTKSNLTAARNWIDENLEKLIRKSIPPDVEPPPPSLLPHRLDKPTYTEATRSYADILKQQFSMAPNATTAGTAHTRPPRKRQATQLNYDSDQLEQSTEYPPLVPNAPNTPSATVSATTTHASPTTVDYAAELQLIKTELASLRTLINSAVEQMKSAVDSIKTIEPVPAREMEIDDNHSTDDRSKDTTPEIFDLITELKTEIATMATEMRAKFQEIRAPVQIPFELTPFPT